MLMTQMSNMLFTIRIFHPHVGWQIISTIALTMHLIRHWTLKSKIIVSSSLTGCAAKFRSKRIITGVWWTIRKTIALMVGSTTILFISYWSDNKTRRCSMRRCYRRRCWARIMRTHCACVFLYQFVRNWNKFYALPILELE